MCKKKNDIISEEDIKFMVDSYYSIIRNDFEVNLIIKSLSKKKWKIDIDNIYNFWQKILFASGQYEGNPFKERIPILISEKNFNKFLVKFTENIDKHFSGENAESAKARATAISNIFQNKLKYIKPKRYRRTKLEIKRDSDNEI